MTNRRSESSSAPPAKAVLPTIPQSGSSTAKQHGAFEVEIVDLRDFPMPFFDEPASPAGCIEERGWPCAGRKKIESLDGFIMTAAEYNHGPTAVLQGTRSTMRQRVEHKPVAFVGYGGVGGARAVEQLRLNAIELADGADPRTASTSSGRLRAGCQGREEARGVRLPQRQPPRACSISLPGGRTP